MPFITAAIAQKHPYDVIVVGSGAAGGQTAYTLTMEGARVLMLEAGRRYDPTAETPMFQTPDQAPLRDTEISDKRLDFYDATVDGRKTLYHICQTGSEPSLTSRKSHEGHRHSRALLGRV